MLSPDAGTEGGQLLFAKQLQDAQESAQPVEGKSSKGGRSRSGLPASAEEKEPGEPSAKVVGVNPFVVAVAQRPISTGLPLIKDTAQVPQEGLAENTESDTLATISGVSDAAKASMPPLDIEGSIPLEARPADNGLTPFKAAPPEPPIAIEPAPSEIAVAVRVKAPGSPAPSGGPAGHDPSGVAPRVAVTREARRVDLDDAPPAPIVRAPAFREAQWILRDTASPAAPRASGDTAGGPTERLESAPVRSEERVAKPAEPLKELSVQLEQPNEGRVQLRVIDRGGDLHVAVRAADGDLANGLRQALPELVNRLEQNGYRAEAWRPSGMVSTPDAAETRQSSAEFRNGDSQPPPGWSQQDRGQRDHHQSSRPQWVEELEGNLGDERFTGEQYGISR